MAQGLQADYAKAGVQFYRPPCGDTGDEALVAVTEETLVGRMMVHGYSRAEALVFMERTTDPRWRELVQTLVDLVPNRAGGL